MLASSSPKSSTRTAIPQMPQQIALTDGIAQPVGGRTRATITVLRRSTSDLVAVGKRVVRQSVRLVRTGEFPFILLVLRVPRLWGWRESLGRVYVYNEHKQLRRHRVARRHLGFARKQRRSTRLRATPAASRTRTGRTRCRLARCLYAIAIARRPDTVVLEKQAGQGGSAGLSGGAKGCDRPLDVLSRRFSLAAGKAAEILCVSGCRQRDCAYGGLEKTPPRGRNAHRRTRSRQRPTTAASVLRPLPSRRPTPDRLAVGLDAQSALVSVFGGLRALGMAVRTAEAGYAALAAYSRNRTVSAMRLAVGVFNRGHAILRRRR